MEESIVHHQAIRLLYEKNLYRIDQMEQDGHSSKSATRSGIQPHTPEIPIAQNVPVVVLSRTLLASGSSTSVLLDSILKACRLEPGSFQILSPFTPAITADTIITKFAPKHILLFGIGSSELGLSVYFPDFQVQQIGNIQYLTAPDLALLENDPDAKQKLWKSLKTAFSLS
jgi:hypothetical protein